MTRLFNLIDVVARTVALTKQLVQDGKIGEDRIDGSCQGRGVESGLQGGPHTSPGLGSIGTREGTLFNATWARVYFPPKLVNCD
jgi:hypothetical protein